MHLWQQRIFGVLAVGGSFLGLVVGVSLILAPGSVLAKVFALPFLGLYCWGIWCGVRMFEGAEGSIRSNRLFWAVQIPYFMSPIAGYFFASGTLFYLTYQPAIAKLDFLFLFGSKFEYSIYQPDKPFVLGVNLFALALCLFLTYRLRAEPSNNSFKPKPLRGSA